METKQLIERLRDKRRSTVSVAYRQALCYYLYKNNIPCTIIAEVLGRTKRYIYMAIYHTQDYLEVGDKTATKCLEDIKNHSIRIVPITAEGVLLSRHIGYKMIIDNITV